VSAAAATVVVPFRSGGCTYRQRALGMVCRWWERQHPQWPLLVMDDTGGAGPWRKGAVIDAAVRQARTKIVVVADADMIAPDVAVAVEAVAAGRAAWASPYRTVLRLTEQATAQFGACGVLPAPPDGAPLRYGAGTPLLNVYKSRCAAGGVVVLGAATALDVPMDPRFAVWKHDDLAWERALTVLAGPPHVVADGAGPGVRGRAWHLWHPPAQVDEATGRANLGLYHRYRRAVHPKLMGPLVEQARQRIVALRAGDEVAC
jgi:hypothetical protein